MDHQGWYARDNSFRTMQDCLFAAAMGPPGGGRAPITQRYQRHYNLLSIVDFDTEALEHIFGTILAWFYDERRSSAPEIASKKDVIIKATLDVYTTAIEKLLPTPAKSHYTFNLRDVSRVIEGMTLQKAVGLDTGLGGVGEHFRLWVHESMRVFYDRLVSDEDRSWFLEYVSELTTTHFAVDFNELFVHLDVDGDGVGGRRGTEALHVRGLARGRGAGRRGRGQSVRRAHGHVRGDGAAGGVPGGPQRREQKPDEPGDVPVRRRARRAHLPRLEAAGRSHAVRGRRWLGSQS